MSFDNAYKKRPADLSIVRRLGGFSCCKDTTFYLLHKCFFWLFCIKESSRQINQETIDGITRKKQEKNQRELNGKIKKELISLQ